MPALRGAGGYRTDGEWSSGRGLCYAPERAHFVNGVRDPAPRRRREGQASRGEAERDVVGLGASGREGGGALRALREIASGGMATVHFGRLLGPVGFSRTVAIKRLHPQFAKDPEFVAMFLDEARLAARIRHPNVVPTLDVVALERRALPRHGVRRRASRSRACSRAPRRRGSGVPPRDRRRRS